MSEPQTGERREWCADGQRSYVSDAGVAVVETTRRHFRTCTKSKFFQNDILSNEAVSKKNFMKNLIYNLTNFILQLIFLIAYYYFLA